MAIFKTYDFKITQVAQSSGSVLLPRQAEGKVLLRELHRGQAAKLRDNGDKDIHLRAQMVNTAVWTGNVLGELWSTFRRISETLPSGKKVRSLQGA